MIPKVSFSGKHLASFDLNEIEYSGNEESKAPKGLDKADVGDIVELKENGQIKQRGIVTFKRDEYGEKGALAEILNLYGDKPLISTYNKTDNPEFSQFDVIANADFKLDTKA